MCLRWVLNWLSIFDTFKTWNFHISIMSTQLTYTQATYPDVFLYKIIKSNRNPPFQCFCVSSCRLSPCNRVNIKHILLFAIILNHKQPLDLEINSTFHYALIAVNRLLFSLWSFSFDKIQGNAKWKKISNRKGFVGGHTITHYPLGFC